MSASRIFKYILANRVPVDDGILHLVISGMEADDVTACIDVYDAYGVPPPKALIHCLSNTVTASFIIASFSKKVTSYILEAHLSRHDVSMSISCMDVILEEEDEFIWYMALGAYAARQALPVHEVDILKIIGTRKAKKRLRDLMRREPSKPYDVGRMKRVIAGLSISSDPVTPIPLVDALPRPVVAHHHHMTYNRIVASINVFTMFTSDAQAEAWKVLHQHAGTIGKVEATILAMMLDPPKVPELLHLLGPRTPCIVMGRIDASYEHLVIRARVGHQELMHYIRTHDIGPCLVDHLLYRAMNGEFQMEKVYYYAMNKMMLEDPTSEVEFLEAHQHHHHIALRLRMIKQIGSLPRRDGCDDDFTIGAEPMDSIPDCMLMDIGHHTFSSSDLYKLMDHDIKVNPYTRVPFSSLELQEMRDFVTSLMMEGYPVHSCTGFNEPELCDDEAYDLDHHVDLLIEDNYLDNETIDYMCRRWDVSVLDMVDVISLARSSKRDLRSMVREMYSDAYQWLIINTGV